MTACGAEHTPWIVSVLPGQRINFTLLDFTSNSSEALPQFSASSTRHDANEKRLHRRRHAMSHCDVYARLDELGTDTVELCGGNHYRVSPAYTSLGSVVKVRLYHRGPISGHNYLVKYEGRFSCCMQIYMEL